MKYQHKLIKQCKQFSCKSFTRMNQDITCILESINKEDGSIYISNLKAAQNGELMMSTIGIIIELQIKSMITCLHGKNVVHPQSVIENHLYIDAIDYKDFDLSVYFEETYEFINRCRKIGNVLVHCHAGISRSSTIVGAYLLKKYGYSLENVLSMMKRKRNKINPNEGFRNQLKAYETKLNELKSKEKDKSKQKQKQKDGNDQIPKLKENITIQPDDINSVLRDIKFKPTRHLRATSLNRNIQIQKNVLGSAVIEKYIKIQPINSLALKKPKQNKYSGHSSITMKTEEDGRQRQIGNSYGNNRGNNLLNSEYEQRNKGREVGHETSKKNLCTYAMSLKKLQNSIKKMKGERRLSKEVAREQMKTQNQSLTDKIERLKQKIIQNEQKRLLQKTVSFSSNQAIKLVNPQSVEKNQKSYHYIVYPTNKYCAFQQIN